MICFNCGIKLHTVEADECQLCGVKFPLRCPACNFPNPSVAKYCFNCGSKVSGPDEGSSIQNFDTLTESRKNVAVIFADISGFTALSEKMDPEEVREVINDCFSYITKPVYELEGTIDKYIGDCIMILFGAKYIHSDDAKRAVLCAMRMMSLIRDFSEERLLSKGFKLNLSIGINFGLVVTGSVGNYFDKDYTVMGDIVNIAQRLQTGAEKDTILVTESVYVETKDVVQYSEPVELVVKNKENPVRCYKPISLNAEFSFENKISFIERENEVNLLNTVYNRVLNNSTQYVAVVGEPGIGKTRLLREFTSKLGNDVKKIWVDCGYTTQNRVYFLISNIIMSIMNVSPEDSTSIKQHRLASFLDYILDSFDDDRIKRNYDFLGLLLGFNRDGEFQSILDSMTFENIKREMLRQLSIFFVNLCKKHRLVVVIDDIQWADSNSLSILKGLMALLPDINAAFIYSTRYEVDEMEFVESSNSTILRLKALSDEATGSLACRLLDCRKIDTELFDAIIRFTRGNPLYIREFISNIRKNDSCFIKGDTAFLEKSEIIRLPNNIQNLILSNLSVLDDTERSILEAASVIGKDFALSLTGALINIDINEKEMLKHSMELNIISLKSAFTTRGMVEKVYTFNHEMEREVIYESILNKRRKELHKKAAELIEVKYAKEIENYYEILSSHFHRAGLYKKAAEYYYGTALKNKDAFNFASSLEYYGRFLELAADKQEFENDARIVYALRDIGQIQFTTANYDKALESLENALQRARMSDDIAFIKIMTAEVFKDKGKYDDALSLLNELEPKLKQDNSAYGKLLQMKCNILRITGNPQALNFAKRSEKALLKAKDYQNLSETMKQAGMIYFTKGDIDNALFYMNKSYRYAEKVNNLEIMAKVSGDMGIVYHSTGMVAKALEAFSRSMDISRKISYQRGYIAACINTGILYMDKGQFRKAEALFTESLQISRETRSMLYECICLTNLGDIMYELGDFRQSEDFYNQSLEVAKSISVPVEEGVNYIGLVRIYMKHGFCDRVSDLLETSSRIFNDTGEIIYLSDCYVYKGACELKKSNWDSALALCDKAIAMAEECRSDKKKLKALRLKGIILTEKGEPDKAIQVFDEAIGIAELIESEYESAKGYCGRSKAFNRIGSFERAADDMLKAGEAIGKVDLCRWTSIIELEKNRYSALYI